MKIQISDRALRELQSIEEYWLSRGPSLYEELTAALNEALLFLTETPYAGSPIERSTARKWRIGRTPFLLFYRVHSNILFVARIRHERESWRRPH